MLQFSFKALATKANYTAFEPYCELKPHEIVGYDPVVIGRATAIVNPAEVLPEPLSEP